MDPTNPYAPPESRNVEAPYPTLGKPTLLGLIEKGAEFVGGVFVFGMGGILVGGIILKIISMSGFNLKAALGTYYETIFLIMAVLGCLIGGWISWRYSVKLQRHEPPSNEESK